MSFYRYLQMSEDPAPRLARNMIRGLRNFSVPAPKILFTPILGLVVSLRSVYYFICRVFYAEPLFKAYCKSYGKRVRTGVFLHWINGKGDIILGDNVLIDGKCSFAFTQRYTPNPTLQLGDYSEVGNGCAFVVARGITIGKHTRISFNTKIFDTSGHPIEADLRRQNKPAHPGDVRPVVIGDDVWVGQQCIIFPGTRIGDGSVISAGSVVRGKIPPYSLVAGNPAKVLATLPRPVEAESVQQLPEAIPQTADKDLK